MVDADACLCGEFCDGEASVDVVVDEEFEGVDEGLWGFAVEVWGLGECGCGMFGLDEDVEELSFEDAEVAEDEDF